MEVPIRRIKYHLSQLYRRPKNIKINYENYIEAYKSIFFLSKNPLNKITFEAFLISYQTIPDCFNKLIQSENFGNDKNSFQNTLKDTFKNFTLDKSFKIYYQFDECEYFINQNYNDKEFIIVDIYFFKYLNININSLDEKKYF